MYAIACGISSGLGYRTNTQTKLILIAFEEITRLCKALGYAIDETTDVGIIGDLMLTCSSTESRNFRFGKLLATHSVKESIEKMQVLVEGVVTASSVTYLTQQSNVSLPLAQFVATILEGKNQEEIKETFLQFAK